MILNQISVFLENRTGRLDEALETLKVNDINILSLALADTSDYGLLRMIVSDSEKCKACGKCIAECPKHLIELVPADATCHVKCSSKDKGPVAMKVCDVACIGCGLCKKNCRRH